MPGSGRPWIVAVNEWTNPAPTPIWSKHRWPTGTQPVEGGGDVEFVGVSAKAMTGIDELLKQFCAGRSDGTARQSQKAMAKAVVVESTLEKGRGPVATVIVQNGTLSVGDNIVCGSAFGRVRALISDRKAQLKKIGPSETAVVVGLNEVPPSGEIMLAMPSDKEAREYAQKRYEYDRHRELSHSTKTTLDELASLSRKGVSKPLKGSQNRRSRFTKRSNLLPSCVTKRLKSTSSPAGWAVSPK